MRTKHSDSWGVFRLVGSQKEEAGDDNDNHDNDNDDNADIDSNAGKRR